MHKVITINTDTGKRTERAMTQKEIEESEALFPQSSTSISDGIRAKRNRLLIASDWTQLSDAPLTPTEQAEWRVYRQALRDVPGQAGFPDKMVWPVSPMKWPVSPK